MSASGKSFTFKGTDFGGASYNLYAKVSSLPRMPRPRVNIDQLAQADGSATQGSTFEDSRITIECAITGSSTANVETLVSNTVAKLATTQEGPGDLVLDSHPTKAWTARLVSGVEGSLGLNGERFMLEFICADPWSHAVTPTTTGDEATGGGGETTI